MRPLPRTCIAVLLGFLLIGSATATAAPEGAEAVKSVLDDIKKAQKDPERSGLASAVERIADIHNGIDDAGLRKKLQAVAGKVLRDAKAGSARSAAAVALGSLNDPQGAWKQLSKALPAPKSKTPAPSEVAAIQATAAHVPAAAIAPLLKLMHKAKSLDAAREAINALGGYGKSKKRAAILKEMLEAMSLRHAAALAAKQNPKGGSGTRPWQELGEPFVAALNRLTGQKHKDADAWLEAYKSNKKQLQALFADAAP